MNLGDVLFSARHNLPYLGLDSVELSLCRDDALRRVALLLNGFVGGFQWIKSKKLVHTACNVDILLSHGLCDSLFLRELPLKGVKLVINVLSELRWLKQ